MSSSAPAQGIGDAGAKGLIAFDLDGTVWPDRVENRMTCRVAAALCAAHERGYALAVSTGRPLVALPIDFLELPWLDWAICSSGAAVYPADAIAPWLGGASVEDPSTLRWVSSRFGSTLRREQLEELFRLTSSFRASYWADTPEGYFVEAQGLPPSLRRFHEKVGRVVDSVATMPELERGAYKLSIHFLDCRDRQQAQIMLENLPGRQFDVANEGETSLECSPKGTSKGVAALSVCKLIGVQPYRSVAFGDSGNDLSFADTPIHFVAMGNAEKKVQEAADEVCPDVFHDGAAVWIERHILDGIG